MNNKLRSVLKVALVSAALVAGPLAWADGGIAGKVAGKVREQTKEANEARKEKSRDESRPESRPAQRSDSRGNNRAESRPEERRAPRPEQRAEPAPAQRSSQPQPAPQQNNARGSERSPDRGLTGALVQREYQTSRGGDGNNGNGNGNGGGSGGGGDRDHDNGNGNGNGNGHDRGNNGRDWDRDSSDHRYNDWYRDRRPGRVVQRLPGGYRDYSWNGGRYYYYSGNWYRPYGSSYISIGIPYGLFVTSLPGAYSSLWFGGTRYFYSDYNYYVYEPARRGYVVTASPYGDDNYDYEDSRLDEDLYIYPARGQSEQQQADDRYECHRWAVRESDYDPIDDEYDVDLREDYLRAMTACLTGRGYTVR